MKKKLTIYGLIPSKKNRNFIRCINGKPIVLKAKAFNDWHDKQMYALIKDKGRVENIQEVIMTLYSPTKRRADLSNKLESVMDLLVDVGILEDDNFFVVPKVSAIFGGVDKNNARAEVEIVYG